MAISIHKRQNTIRKHIQNVEKDIIKTVYEFSRKFLLNES